jgi:hypothetical protein
MGINSTRDRLVVSHAGGEKDIYGITSSSVRLLHRSGKHSHEMPPGRTLFVNQSLTVSASPDFSLNFYDPKMKSGKGVIATLFWLLLFILAFLAILVFAVPESHPLIREYVPHAAKLLDIRGSEL